MNNDDYDGNTPPDTDCTDLLPQLIAEAERLHAIIATLQGIASDAQPAPAEQTAEYTLSEIAILQALAAIAPQLNGAELKILVELASHGSQEVFTSMNAIAKKTSIARSTCFLAIAHLDELRYLRYDAGSQTAHARFDLLFLKTVRMHGPKIGPWQNATVRESDSVQKSDGPKIGPVRKSDHAAAPPDALPRARESRADRSKPIDINPLIDQVLNTTETNDDEATVAAATEALHAHMQTTGRYPLQPPPGPDIVAQFLAIAPWPRLKALLESLSKARKGPSDPVYAWYVTVALNRIHGATPEAIAARREAIAEQKRLLKRLQKAAAAGDAAPRGPGGFRRIV